MKFSILIFLAALSVGLRGASSVERDGVSWTFDGDYAVGQYATGDWYVVAPSGLTVTNITPGWDGTKNGSVLNPTRNSSQGYDTRMLQSSYDAAQNVGDDLPLVVPTNSSLITSIGLPNTATHQNDSQIDVYAVLTVVSAAPPAGSFRPATIGGDYSHPWQEADLNYAALASKSLAGMGAPDISTRSMLMFINEQKNGWTAPPMKAQQASPSYGRDLAAWINVNAILLNSDAGNAAKRDLLVGMVQYGIDIHGYLQDGGSYYPDGGHNNGRMLPLLIAAKTLNDSAMQANLDGAAHPEHFQEFGQTFYVGQADVDQTRFTGDGRPRTAYSSNDIGKPEWGEKHINQPERDGDNWDAFYRDIAGQSLPGSAVVAHLMDGRTTLNWPVFFEYAQRHIYYREGRFTQAQYYNGWDDGDAYGQGNTSDATPFSSNDIPALDSAFFLAYEGDDPVGSDPATTATVTVATALTPNTTASGMVDGLVIGLVPGQSTASVEFKGTIANEGDAVQVRVLRQGDDTVVQDWTTIATPSGVGSWSGTITLPRADDWWYAEVRPAGNPTAIATLSEKFAVGYKIMLLGQSQMRIMAGTNGSGTYTMDAGNHDTASLYSWQEYNAGGAAGTETFYLVNAANGSDGIRAFVDQFRAFDADTPLMIMIEAVSGTSILQFLDDAETGRAFSDLTDKTAKYGGDVSVVAPSWITANASPLDGDTGIEILLGIDTHGEAVDHDLTDALQAGFGYGVTPGTRHRYRSAMGYSKQEVDWANANAYTVGPIVTDYEIAAGDSAHPNNDGQGNVRLGARLAITAARVLDLDDSENPSLAAVYRSFDGTKIIITTNRPNGGSLYSPAPLALRGFEVQENGGSYETTGFSAEIVGNTVELTRNSGTWAAAENLVVGKIPNFDEVNPVVALNEQALVAGELYETWADDVLGLGLPVHGQLVSSNWQIADSLFESVTQLADGETPPDGDVGSPEPPATAGAASAASATAGSVVIGD